ncbi:MAG: YggU family protein [Candidatus Diapherotrites archaeon CG10_big_fil_rev_8_21_14_0_10_31_34]|nr:MAG: YggU family protein [Candidatus Diapherotrites archaeon CG10_big_fil_rev_8_21_14_0_10_31_34]PJA21092.1 MAG: YggU family protein [Candidatus Diapherotrites archaeon CG_4_10_14_0_2_um_filter_31_5]
MKTIDVHIKPGSKKFEVLGFNKWTNCLEIKTKEKAEKNKANKELEKNLKEIFKTEVKIIQGKKSKTKKILIEKTTKEITELIKKNKL